MSVDASPMVPNTIASPRAGVASPLAGCAAGGVAALSPAPSDPPQPAASTSARTTAKLRSERTATSRGIHVDEARAGRMLDMERLVGDDDVALDGLVHELEMAAVLERHVDAVRDEHAGDVAIVVVTDFDVAALAVGRDLHAERHQAVRLHDQLEH